MKQASITTRRILGLAALFLGGAVLALPLLSSQGQQKQPPVAQQAEEKPSTSKEPESYPDENEPCPGTRKQTGEATFRAYTVRTYRWPNAFGCFEVVKDGKQIFRRTGFIYQIGGSPELPLADKTEILTPIGTDVTGRGRPNLVVGEWTGGAHCCFIFYILELGAKKVRPIETIDAEDGGQSHFEDIDHDGHMEFVGNDWNFDYWHTSFAQSPAPDVLLRFRDGKFRLALDLMQKTPPSPEQLSKRATEVRGDFKRENPEPSPQLWCEMLDLIYSGNAKLAWKFLDLAWPPGRPGKKKFRKEFRKRLTKSKYWGDLKDLNGGSI